MKLSGRYAGIVTDNKDPLKLGRIKAKISAIGPDFATDWAFPSSVVSGPGSGFFAPPPVNAGVYIAFLGEDEDVPYYAGGFWGKDDVPEEFKRDNPNNTGYKTPGGHLLEFDDDEETQGIRLTSITGWKLLIDDKTKKSSLVSPGGQSFVLDDDGKKFLLTGTGDFEATLKGGYKTSVEKDYEVGASGKVTVGTSGGAAFKAEGTKLSLGNNESELLDLLIKVFDAIIQNAATIGSTVVGAAVLNPAVVQAATEFKTKVGLMKL